MFDPAKILGGGLKTIGKGFLGKIAEATLGEGAEEGITAALNPFIKMLTYKGETENPFGSWENFKSYLRDIGQSIYQGAIIGGLTLGVSAPGNVDLQKSFSNDVYKAVEKIHNKVKQLKEWRELEASYMYFEELLEERQKEGKAEAKQEALLLILSQKGNVSSKLKECIQNQRELEVLDSWMKLALQAESVQGFEEQIETAKALV